MAVADEVIATVIATKRPSQFDGLEHTIYAFIVDHLERRTYQPSIREICAHCGIRSTKTVADALVKMQAMGLIESGEGRSRGVRLRGVSVKVSATTHKGAA